MPSRFNDWRLTSLTPLPTWALALAALAAIVAVVAAARGLRSEPKRSRKGVLLALRGASALLLIFLILEPGLELLAKSPVRARVALLLDTSRSMRLPASPGGASRAEEAARTFDAMELRTLNDRFVVDAFTFDESAQPANVALLGDAAGAAARSLGPRTDMLGAINQAIRAGAGRPLAGIVVVSDGADNVDLHNGLAPATREALRKIEAPIFGIAVGAGALKDLAIEDVRVDDFAFVRTNVDVDVTITARGFPPTEMPLTLRREGQLVAQTSVRLGGDTSVAHAKLSFVPDETGKFAFTVSAPVFEGEAVAENNRRSFVLQVIRDRVRALLVVGRPSWDERFLRQLLKRDPNVDLVSFFILRTAADDTHAAQEDLSLIPFPTEEIFRDQLKTFDLVIFQNFGFRPYHMAQYLPGLATYVQEGGAFAMLGGEQSFSLGDYAGTPIEDVLPVALLPSSAPGAAMEPFAPRLTEAGARHPLTALVPGAEPNAQLWNALPKLPGHNLVASVKPGAQVLLEDPARDHAPVLAIGEFGRGRSLALTTDASWYWSLVASGAGASPRAYETFWHNTIRWLVRDPAFTPMKLSAEHERFAESDPIALEAHARTADYGASAGSRVAVQIVAAEDGHRAALAEAVAGAEGEARVAIPSLPPGAYKATARFSSPDGTKELGRADDAFVVNSGGPEITDAAPRPELLRALAEATGGDVVPATAAKISRFAYRDPRRVEIGERQVRPLWDRLGTILLLAITLGAEWILRRRWGYA